MNRRNPTPLALGFIALSVIISKTLLAKGAPVIHKPGRPIRYVCVAQGANSDAKAKEPTSTFESPQQISEAAARKSALGLCQGSDAVQRKNCKIISCRIVLLPPQ